MPTKANTIDPVMQEMIDARIEAIAQAHANNLIEGLDMGEDVFKGMLERAREPISTEEFQRREKILWRQRHHLSAATD
ncbi:MAG: hypothetical protein LBL72_00565 [Candidatus Accumulibacter sp.]|jgi:hypothetical protein|nr:hypothetical protein [Accumulibacter sp.]